MIRKIIPTDVPQLKNVLDNCDLFPSEYLEDMIAPYFTDPNSDLIWFTYSKNDEIVSIAYCAPMELTNGTYNLYAIGIHKTHQHLGIGTQMMTYIENVLKTAGQRILIVETSSTDSQLHARNFYLKCGYRKEAVIADFWDHGDDKVIFWKKL